MIKYKDYVISDTTKTFVDVCTQLHTFSVELRAKSTDQLLLQNKI